MCEIGRYMFLNQMVASIHQILSDLNFLMDTAITCIVYCAQYWSLYGLHSFV